MRQAWRSSFRRIRRGQESDVNQLHKYPVLLDLQDLGGAPSEDGVVAELQRQDSCQELVACWTGYRFYKSRRPTAKTPNKMVWQGCLSAY